MFLDQIIRFSPFHPALTCFFVLAHLSCSVDPFSKRDWYDMKAPSNFFFERSRLHQFLVCGTSEDAGRGLRVPRFSYVSHLTLYRCSVLCAENYQSVDDLDMDVVFYSSVLLYKMFLF